MGFADTAHPWRNWMPQFFLIDTLLECVRLALEPAEL
jgi:hypothetical protein